MFDCDFLSLPETEATCLPETHNRRPRKKVREGQLLGVRISRIQILYREAQLINADCEKLPLKFLILRKTGPSTSETLSSHYDKVVLFFK
ncbi:uncharacterized protein PHALS_02895 [Plasmopara halstedii]|uniref:Uncharacterized protein n=1 Tax=Plasmopara halstedii TaxID=4781 RepID=A0A0P1AYZ9_PLAHL|nr:uncharacterized protein PHALS_02895 [Plasmopara halstedii]CEG46495.1 hypothetical protein PHALS_02895 [Plasmopara halstedii]|eukprot:XP_024582864.1 hypothetical protein PHALS_02895 [Plasmopara halstedii]